MTQTKFCRVIIPCLVLTACMAMLFGSDSKTDFILTGAGATFPQPLYEEWIKLYEKQTGIRISYQAIGSGGGIQALRDREVDFGATDAFLSEKEMLEMKTGVLHIPTCLGAVVIIYNLPGKPQLRLTTQLLSDIFLGKIIRWSDS
ncbi:MAG: phosphate transport system substrate-binding protein, partial [Acidobacteriota bacterium]|nr:phosphate transport system substrate-binding protein [Acidobacteriota bacterium]